VNAGVNHGYTSNVNSKEDEHMGKGKDKYSHKY